MGIRRIILALASFDVKQVAFITIIVCRKCMKKEKEIGKDLRFADRGRHH